MFENININSSISVFVQIENHVQFAVAAGQLKADDRLPSVREMSEKLGVNPNTVAKAYRDLEVMGLVYTRRGMGVFIRRGADARCRDNCRRQIVGRLHEVCAEAKAAGLGTKELKDILEKSFASKIGPYGETPQGLLTMAKKR